MKFIYTVMTISERCIILADMKLSDVFKRFFTSVTGVLLCGITAAAAVIALIAGLPAVAVIPAGFVCIFAGFTVSMISGKGAVSITDETERLDKERNLKKLDEAAQISHRIGMMRLSDPEIKKLAARLCYEADSYIASAKASEGAMYDPQTLETINTAASAINLFLKSGNAEAVEKHFGEGDDEAENAGALAEEAKKRTIKILTDSLAAVRDRNRIFNAGDMDAALLDTDV